MKHFLRGGLFAIAMACVLATGCGGSGPPMTKVTGKVTFNGGPPPRPGRIAFSAVRGTGIEGEPNRPGSATFGVDGEFVAETFEEGDGLLPGAYKVRIICLSGLPGQNASYDSVSLVPAGWSPEDLVIQPGQSAIHLEYDVPPKHK